MTSPACEDDCPHTHSPADAAQRLGVSESTLRQQAARRTVPSTLIGGRLSFSDADLAEIIAAGQRTVLPARTARSSPRRRTR
ncbi:helix-turn-helix domain-containing protein [Actinomadura sp. K4S16]|uniref:helix-turn-helix domain-containing protein n=1 Tax=Actinomadura sp. K4S16 TaxID=1316147 RepID=UPI0011EFE480|nr:helix-turn-helix domain-containing protein [Actinomadura sp. K4S16]